MKLQDRWHRLTIQERLYDIPVPMIGISGGIATGKSQVSAYLKKRGLPLIDADQLVKSIYQLKETIHFVQTHYPECVEQDAVNFKRLRELVFSRPEVKTQVEQFIYARLPEAFHKAYAALSKPFFIFYDAPLLFEKNLQTLMDATVLVYAPQSLQFERLMKRDQVSAELAQRMLSEQMNIEDKKPLADLIIENTGTLGELEAKIEKILDQLLVS